MVAKKSAKTPQISQILGDLEFHQFHSRIIIDVNPVNMHMAVRSYLFPLLDAGWNSPIRSIAMNSMGCGGDKKCSFFSCCVLMLFFAHTWQF